MTKMKTQRRRKTDPSIKIDQPDLFAAVGNWDDPQGVPLERWLWRALNSDMPRTRIDFARSLYVAASWTHGSIIEWDRFNVRMFTGYSTTNKAQKRTLLRLMHDLRQRGWIKVHYKVCPERGLQLVRALELVLVSEDLR